MTPKERAAMQQALEACDAGNRLTKAAMQQALTYIELTSQFVPALYDDDGLQASAALREALAEQALQTLSDFHQMMEQPSQEQNSMFMEGYRIGLAEMRGKCATVVTEHAPTCSPHWVSYVAAIRAIKFEGDTGFRPVSEMIAKHKRAELMGSNISDHKLDQKPFDMNDHPPHRLCECRKCMEYFTPLPDCDAFAASGKPMQDHSVGCTYCNNPLFTGTKCNNCGRVIEQPVSQEPVAWNDLDDQELAEKLGWRIGDPLYMTIVGIGQEAIHHFKEQNTTPVRTKDLTDELQQKCSDWGTYWRAPDAHGVNLSVEQATELLRDALCVEVEIAAPVRTKDLTDGEIRDIWNSSDSYDVFCVEFARAVIAADREKNK